MLEPVTFVPIGVVRTPFSDRLSAPRQSIAAEGVRGTIELSRGRDFEHALEDLQGWDYLWVVFCFHLNTKWRPKVLPPRSVSRRGVFSTRSPHRPNPIGLSVVRLHEVVGLTLHVSDVDMVDGSPVLDIKPYVPYADARPSARTGWLGLLPDAVTAEAPDPEPGFEVVWSELAQVQAAWLLAEGGVDLTTPVNAILRLGPQPHPYRRIKREGGGLRLALKAFRVRFHVEGRCVTVDRILTGYRAPDLFRGTAPDLPLHRAFVAAFPP